MKTETLILLVLAYLILTNKTSAPLATGTSLPQNYCPTSSSL